MCFKWKWRKKRSVGCKIEASFALSAAYFMGAAEESAQKCKSNDKISCIDFKISNSQPQNEETQIIESSAHLHFEPLCIAWELKAIRI